MQERSKPIQPPKKPEAAPFFLPTVSTLARNPVFANDAPTEPNSISPGTLPGWGDGLDSLENAGKFRTFRICAMQVAWTTRNVQYMNYHDISIVVYMQVRTRSTLEASHCLIHSRLLEAIILHFKKLIESSIT